MSTRKGGLGRGLDALIPTSIIPTEIKTQAGVIAADRDEIDVNTVSYTHLTLPTILRV